MAADPVKVDSQHYTVEVENESVRLLRIRYGPGERSVMHSHPAGLAVFLTDGHFRFSFPNGESEERRGSAGQALWMPAEEHLPENLGDAPAEVLLMELKTRSGAAAKARKAKPAARAKASAKKGKPAKRPKTKRGRR